MAETMFERYGGFATVYKVVEAFYGKVLRSERLATYFVRVDTRRLIDHQTKFVASLMGGPASYSDDVLRRIHARMRIDEDSFKEVGALLQQTLEEFQVEPRDVDLIMEEIVRRAPYIVTAEADGSTAASGAQRDDGAGLPPEEADGPLLDAVESAVAVAETDSLAIGYANRRFATWFGRRGAPLPTLRQIFPDLDVEAMRACLRAGRPFTFDARSSGEEPDVPLGVRITPRSDGGTTHLLVQCADRSDVKKMEYMLQSYSKMIEDQSRKLRAEKERVEGLLQEISWKNGQLSRAIGLVTDSINYASRIQASILPDREALRHVTRDHFLIWEPRDVVSGDFFWFRRVQGGYTVVVGDCTGHGVPGAFMTLIVAGLLDRVFQAVPPDAPSRILSRLHCELQALLGQDQRRGETDDGLEAGVCFVGDAERRLVYAGARFSLWRAGNGAVDEIRGDRAGLGYRRYPADTAFTDVPLELDGGVSLYLTTDGLIDQIGGERHRSFGKRRFGAFVAEHHRRPMPEQAAALARTLADYQGGEARRDDVTVLGFAPLLAA